jgi:N-acetylmuramoyl-L-alanine amidase
MKKATVMLLGALLSTPIIIMAFIAACCAPALAAGTVTMRASQHEGFVRIVFEGSDDDIIKQAVVARSYSLIKIDFKDDIVFQGGAATTPGVGGAVLPAGVSVSQKEKSLFLNVKNLKDIKEIRLISPPRLVLDAFFITGGTGFKKSPDTAQTASGFAAYVEAGRDALVIDAGHGGADRGVVEEGFKESAVALAVAQSLAKSLGKDFPKKIQLVRKDDRAVPLDERIRIADGAGAGIFLSIHVSSSNAFVIYLCGFPQEIADTNAKYNTAYAQLYHLEKSRELAGSIGGALKEKFKTDVRRREMPVAQLCYASAPAVMVELPGGRGFSYGTEMVAAVSDAIKKGVLDFAKK